MVPVKAVRMVDFPTDGNPAAHGVYEDSLIAASALL